ncbi:MAG TPA: response regulator [Propionibacteriaceae bacterium]|nr:response regulator [Propionibacteriaceae bacterium]
MISVVVIDDDFRVAKIHSSFISRIEGFEVAGVAHSGAEALTLVPQVEPDLILLDLYLPDVFGLDLLNQLRVKGLLCDVIVISAANESETVQQAVQLGVTNYLLKPFAFADLKNRLEDYKAQRADRRQHRLGDQSDIDRFFGRTETSQSELLPKGMSPETARLVLTELAKSTAGLSALECAELVGISRVSARRYLEHYTTKGLVEVRLRYGSAGRPERRYAVVPTARA